MMSGDDGKGAMTVTNGLYTIQIEMTDGGHGRANGVIVLHDGKIAGGDSYFYYTGSYRADHGSGKWRGELITNEHTKSAGSLPLFGGREVTCGFTGGYSRRCGGSEWNGAGRKDQRGVSRQAEAAFGVLKAASAVHDRLCDHAVNALGAVDGLRHPQVGGEAAQRVGVLA